MLYTTSVVRRMPRTVRDRAHATRRASCVACPPTRHLCGEDGQGAPETLYTTSVACRIPWTVRFRAHSARRVSCVACPSPGTANIAQ
eukprot:12553758-Alexandrium_andersonii.AAC.1